VLTTVEGRYENGRVELVERPVGVERARVYVTFLVDHTGAQDSAHDDAVESWLAFLSGGLALGGPPYPKRDELYDRGDSLTPRVADR
jgi:hypothetical protein